MSKVDAISTRDFQPTSKTVFSNVEKRDELARELNMRKVVYPGLIRAGRLTHESAEKQRAILTEIWQEYSDKVEAEKASASEESAEAINSKARKVTVQDVAEGIAVNMAKQPIEETKPDPEPGRVVAGRDDGEILAQIRAQVVDDRPADRPADGDQTCVKSEADAPKEP